MDYPYHRQHISLVYFLSTGSDRSNGSILVGTPASLVNPARVLPNYKMPDPLIFNSIVMFWLYEGYIRSVGNGTKTDMSQYRLSKNGYFSYPVWAPSASNAGGYRTIPCTPSSAPGTSSIAMNASSGQGKGAVMPKVRASEKPNRG